MATKREGSSVQEPERNLRQSKEVWQVVPKAKRGAKKAKSGGEKSDLEYFAGLCLDCVSVRRFGATGLRLDHPGSHACATLKVVKSVPEGFSEAILRDDGGLETDDAIFLPDQHGVPPMLAAPFRRAVLSGCPVYIPKMNGHCEWWAVVRLPTGNCLKIGQVRPIDRKVPVVTDPAHMDAGYEALFDQA